MPSSPLFRRPTLAVVALIVVVLAACGGSDDSESASTTTAPGQTTIAPEEGDGSTTTEPDETTTEGTSDEGDDAEPGSDTTAPEGGGDSPEAPADLSAALLTVEDLPAGYTRDDEDGDANDDAGDDENEGFCEGTPVGTPPEPVEDLERSFESEQFDSISSQVSLFEGEGAGQLFDLFRDEIARCEGQPSPLGGSYTLAEVDGIGDEAFTLTLTEEGDPGALTFNLARVGDVVLTVTGVLDDAAAVDEEALLTTMADRLG